MTEFSTGVLQPFYATEIFAEAKRLEDAGRVVLHLEFGEPSAAAAPDVLEAVRKALDTPQKYTVATGILALRERLAAYYEQKHSVVVSPDNIIVTTGSSAGFLISFLAAFASGAKIAVTRPGYPAYLNILNGLGFDPVEIPLSAKNGWRLSAEDVRAAYAKGKFDGLLFASPANPTGAVVSGDGLRDIVNVCAELNVQLISDEIYHGLEYGTEPVSALETSPAPVIVNSFSKYYCMTGWRIGWLVLPDHLVRKAEILQQNMFISAPSMSQHAALAALGAEAYCLAQKAVYEGNRTMLNAGLAQLGFDGAGTSDGAFYAYVDASRFTNDSMLFCKELLNATGVAATPGIDFDRIDGGKYVRFSFAGAPESIGRALEKMAGFLKP